MERALIPEVLVFADDEPKWLYARTIRSLVSAGVCESKIHPVVGTRASDDFAKTLRDVPEGTSLWIVQAGSWLQRSRWRIPPESSTGRSLIAVGFPRPSPLGSSTSNEVEFWDNVRGESQGDLESYWRTRNPSVVPSSLWLGTRGAAQIFSKLKAGVVLDQAIQEEMNAPSNRLVYWPDLNVGFDRCRRVVQVITSLQRGGAERLAMDLHESWRQRAELCPLLVALGAPTRDAYPNPNAFVELSHHGARPARVEAAARLVEAFGADLVHSHLLHRAELRTLASTGVPQLATIHNARPGWTFETEHLDASDVSLLIGCSMAVEKDIRDAGMPVPSRSIWNGIDPSLYRIVDPEKEQARKAITSRMGIEPDSSLVIAVANIRPQKRMERLPGILQLAQSLMHESGSTRPVHLLIAGERSSGNEMSAQSEELLRLAIAECDVATRVHRLGSVTDIRELLAAADVLLSTSDYEGLSLAHLEALAAGVPVVATAVGGTSEIGGKDQGILLLPKSGANLDFATIVASLLGEIRRSDEASNKPVPGRTDLGRTSPVVNAILPGRFHLSIMVDRYWQMYQRVISAEHDRGRKGLWLVINNLSTGGAQSSVRRLLRELKVRGHDVRVALLQETPQQPTPGRLDLLSVGIPVLTLIPAGQTDPLIALQPLLSAIDEHPPEALVLWNVIAEYKVLLSDLLYNHRLFDVSPGEMNFQSLEKYFAKPRAGLPYLTAADYGHRLAGAIVKFRRELPVASEMLKTQIHVIPNGVLIPGPTVQHAEKSVVVLGTAARISPQKKLEDLIDALRIAHPQMPPYELRIAGAPEWGDDEYFNKLRKSAEGLSIIWLGDIQDMSGFLMSLDVFVMISHPAGCPNASLEAMAAGLPVIATDVGGVNEQVIDGTNGHLLKPSNPAEFAAAMLELSLDWQLRRRFGEASRTHVATNFSLQKMADDYERILGLSCPSK